MTPTHIVKVLATRWKIVAACGALGLVLAIAYALLATPVYRATAQVLLNIRAPETVGTQSVADQLSPDYLLTQEDILKSRRVAREVVSRLGLATEPGAAERFGWTPRAEPLEDYLANNLRSRLEVGSSAVNSRVFSIGFVSDNRQFAAQMANAFAEAFADITIQLQSEPARRTVNSYSQQLTALTGQLRAAEAKLAAREKDLGIVASKGESDADSIRLDALSTQLAGAQAQDAALRARNRAEALPDLMNSPVLQGLQAEIARLEGQRRLLGTVAGPNNPEYRQLDSQIAGLREQQRAQEALVRRTTAAAATQAATASANLAGALAAQRQNVIRSRAAKNEVSILQQDVNNLKALYDQIAARRAQLQVLEDTGQSNVAILTPAVPTRRPVWPNKMLVVSLGLFGGLAFGAAISLLIELTDRRLRSSDQLETWLGIHDMGSIRSGRRAQFGLLQPVTRLLSSS